eukprot:Skav210113  [mRNA]  locus=scaffold2194:68004:70151:+ [translate_table: standard]
MDLTRSQHVLLVASAEFFLPHVKGKLMMSREALRGRASAEPVKHTIPLTAECALLFAAWHCSEGRERVAAAMLVQHATGLRPSELLSLTTEHVRVPLDRNRAITFRLGANYSTKVKREQYVLIHPESQGLAYALVDKLLKQTSPGQRLFPFGYSAYNNAFKQVEQHYQLHLGTTAHSGRAGFATQSVLQGIARKEIQARGRWLSESSFNTYIDIAGASHIAALVGTQQLAQTAAWLNVNIWGYFGLAIPSHVQISGLVSESSGEARLSPEVFSRHDPRATRPLHQNSEEPVPQFRMEQWDKLHSTETPFAPAPKAKAKAGPSFVFGGGRQRSLLSRSVGRLFGPHCVWASVWLLIVVVAGIMGGSHGPLFQIARLLGVMASLGESTSAAAGQAVNVTGALAIAASEVITAATSNGLNAAENAWRGVDVGDLVAHRCAGLLTVDGPEALLQWINSTSAPVLIPCLTPSLHTQMLAATSSVSLALPSVQTADESLDMLAHFNATKVWAHLVDSGRIQVHYEVVTMSFAVCWANPLWTRLELELGSEREQILRLLRMAVISLPSPTPSTGIRNIDLEVQVSWPVIRSKLLMLSRSYMLKLSTWFDASLRGWGLSVVFSGVLLPLCFFFGLTILSYKRDVHQVYGREAPLPLVDVDLTLDDDPSPMHSHPGVEHDDHSGDSSSFTLLSAVEKSSDSPISEHSYLFEDGTAGALAKESGK